METNIFNTYVSTNFQTHLKSLNFVYPNSNTTAFRNGRNRIDRSTIFFGGKDWENYKNDIAAIPFESRELFLISLYTITVIDLNMFTHFRRHYRLFREQTNYPKFGWIRENYYFEKPKKLLSTPASIDNFTFDWFDAHSKEYALYFYESAEQFFKNNNIRIIPDVFVHHLLEDYDFRIKTYDRGKITEKIYKSLFNKINNIIV